MLCRGARGDYAAINRETDNVVLNDFAELRWTVKRRTRRPS